MKKTLVYILLTALLSEGSYKVWAQLPQKEEEPVISYTGQPRQYTIGGIAVKGIPGYEDYLLVGISGLSVGQQITVPGSDITTAVKRYWKNGLFSNVSIQADSIVDNKIFLHVYLSPRPRLSAIHYTGIKKGEREDLQNSLGLVAGNQITPNILDRAKILIKRYYDKKGFKNAEATFTQKNVDKEHVDLTINIDKKLKTKVHKIYIYGNKALTEKKIKGAMKKTHEKGKLLNLFKAKKFIQEKYEEDKQFIIDRYNEYGYRDAVITADTVRNYDDRSVDIYLHINEGQKYYVRNITWVGNTIVTTDWLNHELRMSKGDVYNQKLMNERLTKDDDAISNYYYNNGYVFSRVDPVETNVEGDSIDLQMRITEGPQATINHVRITGNDRVYENVIRRELRTKPGDLFSKDALERSYRELAQMGHFNPETIKPDVQPDYENGTVDINYILESKGNDQIEFSAGWGQTGVIGKLSLKFTNFSMAGLFSKNKNKRGGFLPQGDGQTLTISGQTNGTYYQSYSLSFFDPWFGGKRPNSLSVSGFYSKQTDVNSNYYNQAYMNNYYNMLYGGGYYNSNYSGYYDAALDPDKSVQIWGLSAGFGKRLRWPDDYFTFSASLEYERYNLKNWEYFIIQNGKSNNINLTLSLDRNSTDNQIYPRRGSEFSASVSFTPPYSLFDHRDYKNLANNPRSATYQNEMASKYEWIEYHKWKLRFRNFTALTKGSKCPVLMTRFEMGLLGSYNKYKKSPFETYYMGGDGMSGYSGTYATETIGLRGYENGSLTPYGSEAYAYSRMTLELRYPLMLETSTSIYVLGFLEGGNAWQDVKNFNPFNIKRSAGLGVRIFLPMVGMMGIDWAYGFDKVNGSFSESHSQFHFILGQEF